MGSLEPQVFYALKHTVLDSPTPSFVGIHKSCMQVALILKKVLLNQIASQLLIECPHLDNSGHSGIGSPEMVGTLNLKPLGS